MRYKQTFIGIAWALVRPLLTMIVFTIIFEKIVKLPSEGVPYPIMVFVAMLPWQFFASAISEASNNLIVSAKDGKILSKGFCYDISFMAGLNDFAFFGSRATAISCIVSDSA